MKLYKSACNLNFHTKNIFFNVVMLFLHSLMLFSILYLFLPLAPMTVHRFLMSMPLEKELRTNTSYKLYIKRSFFCRG